jgi:uncharacterized membrane protein
MQFLESIFEFLFKYRPATFEKGELTFGAPSTVIIAVLLVAGAIVAAVITYQRVRAKSTPRDRAILVGLRVATLAVLLLCLFRPMLVLSAALPQRNFVGILLDDSRSMQIADRDGKPRSEFITEHFTPEQSALMKALSERFMLRFFRFSSNAERTTGPVEMTYTGDETHLGDALDRSRQELSSVPLSGLVVVSDGADNSHTPLTEQLLSMRARGVPVFTVGVGRERFTKDIEVSRVDMPHTALKGASVVVDLLISQSGYGGRQVPLVVEDAGRIVTTDTITLPPDGEAAPVRVHVTTMEKGPRLFKFRVVPQDGEMVAQNNEQEALVDVSDRKEKILYFEGEPRSEYRFLRAAVEADPNLQVVGVVRTAENKYWRAGLDEPDELIAGFPKTREELFKYRSLILGSVEASHFSHDQLKMMAEFVSERGGGLLLLGGRRSFAEGGYAGTPLEDVMPVRLDASIAIKDPAFRTWLAPSLTPAGRANAATQIASSSTLSEVRWRDMPAVTSVNAIADLKPGATALLTGEPTNGSRGGPHVILAYQRFGRGKSLAMPIQDSWHWQMAPEQTVEDQTHETFWRQLLRTLVSAVPGNVTIIASSDRVAPKSPVVFRAEVDDATFLKVNNAKVVAQITGPDGSKHETPMEWTVDRDGEYRASFTPEAIGLYEIRVDAKLGDTLVVSDTTFVQAAQLNTEYFDAEMQATAMKRIAEETGGKFYTAENLAKLPEDLTYTKSGATVLQQMDLWDMPAIFLLLVALISAEWAYRKARGLA